MDSPIAPEATPPTLVLIVGPIAGGKSTVARAFAARLRESGETVALVELDQIAEMALPTLPDWAFAHSIFSSVVGQWLSAPMTVVVAEGPGNRSEVDGVLTRVPPAVSVMTVVLTSSFEIAFARAQADPSRGISRNREFLSHAFESWARDLPDITRDLLIDTATTEVDDSVARILGEFRQLRG